MTEPFDSIEAMAADAVHRIVTLDFGEESTPPVVAQIILQETDSTVIQAWTATYGNTAGPGGGVGGQTLTSFRIVSILVGHTLAYYINGGFYGDMDARSPAGQRYFNQREVPSPWMVVRRRDNAM